MAAKIAINGFGRIGRLFFRQAFLCPELEIAAVNDLGDVENLAYLLKYDTVYGRFSAEVKANKEKNIITVNGKDIQVFQVKDPAELPWRDLGIDIAVEATGIFESFEKAKVHLAAGAKRVVITAPAKDADGSAGLAAVSPASNGSPQVGSTSPSAVSSGPNGSPQVGSTGPAAVSSVSNGSAVSSEPNGKTILMGVNEDELHNTVLTSNGSCTTNAASPVIQVLSENPGISKAILNTVHGYTATQNLTDGPTKGRDFRRGRAAAQNIVPSTTGAAIAVTRAIPELTDKFDGVAIRVPVPSGSVADITFLAKRKVTKEEINDILRQAAAEPRWRGILAVTEEQVVSSDIVGQPYGAIVDLNFTKVVDGDLVKVFSWYDNEFGYVATLVKHVLAAARLV